MVVSGRLDGLWWKSRGDAQRFQDLSRPAAASGDSMFMLRAQPYLHHVDGAQSLQGGFTGQVTACRLQLLFKCPLEQKSEHGHEDVSLDPPIVTKIDGTHFDDVLQTAKCPLHLAQFFICSYGFNWGKPLFLRLNQVFAFVGLL